MFGIFLIIASLLFDGLVSSQTDMEHQRSGRDYAYSLMFSNNLVQLAANAGFFLFTWLTIGDDSVARILSDSALLRDVFMISASGALGQIFIYFAISIFNNYLLAVITTSRKLFSVVISNVTFSHHLSPMQWLGAGLVTACTFAELYIGKKNKDKERDAKKLLNEGEGPLKADAKSTSTKKGD